MSTEAKKLYALNKDNSIQVWYGEVTGEDNFTVYWGKMNGKIQSKTTKCTPKNVGRANETSFEQQTLFELESSYTDQIRKGYFENLEDVKVDETQVMLACDALKKPNAIKYPCSGMPKLDGLRLLCVFEDNEPVFISRGNKRYPVHKHLREQLIYLREQTGIDKFDGEMYIHGVPLQKITSLAKKVQKGSEDLTYQIFDIPSNKHWMLNLTNNNDKGSKRSLKSYGDCRFTDLYCKVDFIIINHCDVLTHMATVDCRDLYDDAEAKEYISKYMEQGYEGLILRNYSGLYEYGQRSNDLIKWKVFQDTEALVYDVEIDKNQEGVLKCKLKNGIMFKCKIKGTHEERLYGNQLKLVGKFVKVKFQQFTVDGVPQFPVALCVRELDPKTWEPLE